MDVKLLTASEAEYYIKQVERLGKARSLPDSQLDRHRGAYDTLVAYLNENFKGFMGHYITGGRNSAAETTIAETVNRANKTGLMNNILASLRAGDSDMFIFYCWILKGVYKHVLFMETERKKEYEKIMGIG